METALIAVVVIGFFLLLAFGVTAMQLNGISNNAYKRNGKR